MVLYLFNEFANPGMEAIMGAVVLANWPSDPPATISLGQTIPQAFFFLISC